LTKKRYQVTNPKKIYSILVPDNGVGTRLRFVFDTPKSDLVLSQSMGGPPKN